jgi:Flp pilus assembly protein CpaB
MRRSRQIILTLLLTAALLSLAWFAGRGRTKTPQQRIVVLSRDVAAGSQLTASDLVYVLIPADQLTDAQITDLTEAVGSWTEVPLYNGEWLHRERLSEQPSGLSYPNAGPGRRLLTISLDAADANGYWLSAGSLVDLYLIPRSRQSLTDYLLLEKVRIMAVLDGSTPGQSTGGSRASPLICLDLSTEQAGIISGADGLYQIRLVVVNESTETGRSS